jgi:hypothetical protein
MKRLEVRDHTSRLALWGNPQGMLNDLGQREYLEQWGIGLDVVPHACDEYAVMLVSSQTSEIQTCSATPLGRGDLSASARELTTRSEEKPVQ